MTPSSPSRTAGRILLPAFFVTAVSTLAFSPSALPATAAEPQTIQTCGAAFHQGDSLDPLETTWPSALIVDKFDPALGTLVSVNVSGVLRDGGYVGVENSQDEPLSGVYGYSWNATLTTTFGETYDLVGTYDGEFANSWDRASEAAALGPFDGTADFAGTSGRILTPAEKSFSASYAADAPAAANFVGPGALELFSPTSGLLYGGTYSGLGGTQLERLGWGQLITAASEDGAVGPSACVTYTYLAATVPTGRTLAATGNDPAHGLVIAGALFALGGIGVVHGLTRRRSSRTEG